MLALECVSVVSALGAVKARLWAGAGTGADAVGALVAAAERAAAVVGPHATAVSGAPAQALSILQLVVKTFAHVCPAAVGAAASAGGDGDGGGLQGVRRASRRASARGPGHDDRAIEGLGQGI